MDLVDVRFLVERFLSIRSAWQGGQGPDGCIYYLSNVTGIPLLWRACPNGVGRLAHDIVLPWQRRIGDYKISPAGGIAFTSDFDGDEKWALYHYTGSSVRLVSGEDGSMNLLGAWDSGGHRLAYTSNKRNNIDFDYYVYDSRTGESRLVAGGQGIATVEAWLDENTLIAVKRNTNLDTDIILVNVETGDTVNLTSHKGEEQNTNPRPLGDRIIYLSNRDSEYTGIWTLDPATGEARPLYNPGHDVELLEVAGGLVYAVVNREGASRIEKLTPHSGRLLPQAVHEAKWTVSTIAEARRGLIVSASSPTEGVEVFIIQGPRLEKATESPKLGLSGLFTEPWDFHYESFDGLRIHGLVYEPRGRERPHPAVVWLHGGPESQARPGFNILQQALQALGIAVVAPNFRGSTGYGKTFTHLDDVEKRMDAVRDVAEAVKSLVREGVIREKPCVMGGSYGGYLTLMSLGVYPELWSCGVSIVGIVNLVTFIRNTSPYRRHYRIVEYGDPDKHGEVMLQLSPISYVHRIKAPLMVIHGARDPRVPVSEAEQLVEALRSRGVDVEYMRLEDEGHGIVKIENRLRVYTRAIQFILEHLKR